MESHRLTTTVEDKDAVTATYTLVRWRILPFLLICYLVAFLDRNNIGFAKLNFTRDLHMSEAAYGFAAGIFYLGYILFEIPSNLVLARVGARKSMMRILILWGLASAGTAFVNTPFQFNIMRFLLGVAEAGFFPGVLLYLTLWAPSSQRARFISVFMAGIPVSGILGSPISGWIMHTFEGVGGLKSWQWLFVIEGLPACLLGVMAFFYLKDSPDDAHWLTPDQKAIVRRDLQFEHESKKAKSHHSFGGALRDFNFYLLTLMAFALFSASAGIFFWLPTIIRRTGISNVLHIGFLSAIPYLVGAFCQIVIGRHSDRVLERRWHTAVPALIGAAGWILLPLHSGNTVYSIVMLAVAAGGTFGAMPTFWTIPSAFLTGKASAGGIASISTLGAIGGFVSPTVIGWIVSRTGGLAFGQIYLAVLLAVSAVTLLVVVPKRSEAY